MDDDGAEREERTDTNAETESRAALSWELLDSVVDYSCPGFDVRRDDVRLPDGVESDFHYVDEPPAVVILPFTPDDDLVVIEEWRQAVGRVSRGLPAGTTEERDESLETAARRELTEETGYEAGALEPLLESEPLNGLANAVHHYFVAHDCTPTGEQNLDFNESIHVSVTGYETLLNEALDGSVRDGRTLLGLFAYELHGD